LALAKYYHSIQDANINSLSKLLIPSVFVIVPTIIVFIQPDLGTALVIALGSLSIFWVAGLSYRYFISGGLIGLLSIPITWQFLREYQKERVFTFFNPERDPLGNGYHILQSKIALGSGGFFGKGYLDGTQSHLNFLPEMHNDFIFTMFGEEFGFLGSIFLIIIYLSIILISFRMAMASKSLFSRYLSIGVTFVFSLYVLINISMVMGLIPVVGVPLPFLSYGGSSTLAIMGGFGLLMNCYIHQRTNLEKGDFF
jgi:rod shape determining protein RodA